MARSQQTFGKREREAKRDKKKKEKEERKAQRKESSSGGNGWESMMAYLDENGNIVDSPPEEGEREEINAEDIVLGVPKKEKEIPSERQGRVSFFDHSKGFGFIMETGSQDKFFVHQSKCLEVITEGDKVLFEGEKGMKGMDAIKVRKA